MNFVQYSQMFLNACKLISGLRHNVELLYSRKRLSYRLKAVKSILRFLHPKCITSGSTVYLGLHNTQLHLLQQQLIEVSCCMPFKMSPKVLYFVMVLLRLEHIKNAKKETNFDPEQFFPFLLFAFGKFSQYLAVEFKEAFHHCILHVSYSEVFSFNSCSLSIFYLKTHDFAFH